MKKLIALLMVSVFALAFVACGGGAKNEADSTDSTSVETPAEEPAPAEETPVEGDTTEVDTTAAQ